MYTKKFLNKIKHFENYFRIIKKLRIFRKNLIQHVVFGNIFKYSDKILVTVFRTNYALGSMFWG